MSWEDYENFEDDGDRNEEVKIKYLAIARETEKAWLLTLEINEAFEPVQVWLPKSQCDIDLDGKIVHVPQWLVDSNDISKYQEN